VSKLMMANTCPRVLLFAAAMVTAGMPEGDRDISARPVTGQTTLARAGVCEREAETLLGQQAVRISESIHPPKRLRGLPPVLPELPNGTTAMGMWIGEALIDSAGKVARVWPTREVRFKPAFPEFNQAIADAVRRWEYRPLLINGTPTPFCMTVSSNVDFQ
jgi:hypothetical protein